MRWRKSPTFGLRTNGVTLLSAFATIACGGQIDSSDTALDTGGRMSTANTGGVSTAGGSGSEAAGGTFDVLWEGGVGVSRADAGAACSLPASDFDSSCVTDADCTEVSGGDPCIYGCHCFIAMNVRVAEKYMTDFMAIVAITGEPPLCHCPCIGTLACCQGRCQNGCGGCQ
jgi:hypothetical protein